jgi:hypothetical protein
MPSAKFTQTYEKITKMGEKLKAAGKQGPSNDEQLNVRLEKHPDLYIAHISPSYPVLSPNPKSPSPHTSLTPSSIQLYAYAKVAQGQDFSAAKKPGMFDLAVRTPHAFPRDQLKLMHRTGQGQVQQVEGGCGRRHERAGGRCRVCEAGRGVVGQA